LLLPFTFAAKSCIINKITPFCKSKEVLLLPLNLDTNIQHLTGVGPKRAARYHKIDSHPIRDRLSDLPRPYLSLPQPPPIAQPSPPPPAPSLPALLPRPQPAVLYRRCTSVGDLRAARTGGGEVLSAVRAHGTHHLQGPGR